MSMTATATATPGLSPSAVNSTAYWRGRALPDRLTVAEEQALAARRLAGDAAARERFILANVPLAIDRAGRQARGRHHGEMDRLVSAAIQALIQAVDEYRPGTVSAGRVVRFGTYAAVAIDRAVRAATLREFPVITLPHRCLKSAVTPGTARPTEAEDREARKSATLGRLRGSGESGAVRGAGVEEIADPASFRGMAGGSAGIHEPDVHRALTRLAGESFRQAQAIALLYGISGGDPMGPTEVGGRLGMTRQSVITTRDRALRNLRKILREMEAEG